MYRVAACVFVLVMTLKSSRASVVEEVVVTMAVVEGDYGHLALATRRTTDGPEVVVEDSNRDEVVSGMPFDKPN